MNSIHEMEATSGSDNSREKTIIRTSIIGIAANVLLAAFKAAVGLITNSIAIVLDAVNNISDAGSSLITIVGTRLAGKEPDKKHPFGYGRIEYLSAMVISVIVLYAGITSFIESVKQIIHPETPDYNAVSLIIVAVLIGSAILCTSSSFAGDNVAAVTVVFRAIGFCGIVVSLFFAQRLIREMKKGKK